MEFFIAGTDTGAGKTFVTAILAAALIKEGLHTGVQKWITTGGVDQSGDVEFVRSALSGLLGAKALEKALFSYPYCLSFPASPHLAAEIDGIHIDPEKILDQFEKMKALTDVLLIEGTGGIMVPITRKFLYTDLLEQLRPKVILVARSGLGTINHTLLTLEALRTRGLEVLCVVMNPVNALGDKDDSNSVIVRDNKRIIGEIGGIEVIGPLPFCQDLFERKPMDQLVPLAQRIKEMVK